jgi:hypothetical protein
MPKQIFIAFDYFVICTLQDENYIEYKCVPIQESKNIWPFMLGYGIIALQILGVMKKQNVRDLNLHKPRILTQKSNDIFKCGSSFKIKLVNHFSPLPNFKVFYNIDLEI